MYFDVLMPAILFLVTFVAMLLGRKAESKLKSTVENREFKNRDIALIAIMIALAVSVVVFIPSMALLGLFLFSYSSLLFIVSYVFSSQKIRRTYLYCIAFIITSILAIGAGFTGIMPIGLTSYGILAFTILGILAFIFLLYTQNKPNDGLKWYLALLPPILFLLLFTFFNSTYIWYPYLMDIFGIIFAMLIVIYLSTLFTWKTVIIFAGILTVIDIVLVWLTQTMVQAADQVSGLGLPVLVAFPTIPIITDNTGVLFLRLGLGDFFFAGILACQTLKKFGIKTAVVALFATSVSFGLFELILLNKELADALPIPALPATLPILIGWLPVVIIKTFTERKSKQRIRVEFNKT